jgi:protein-tyrosine phosphatase
MTFSILSVCTGNICRSPVAELILAHALAPFADVQVESAGTGALVGSVVPEQAQRLAATRGIDASAHRARQIDVGMIRGADLIVAMSRDHRRLIVETLPASMRRAFTLRELARIADELEHGLPDAVTTAGARTPEDGMRAAVSYAAALRGTVPPPASPEEFDIVDPYRRPDEVYALSFEELSPAADRVAAFLAAGARAASAR